MITWIYTMINRLYRVAYSISGSTYRSQRMVKRGGFTIVEMLLVVVVIALVAGAGGGLYLGTYKKVLAEKAARDFFLAAKYARITAIERQSPCTIELDVEAKSFALSVDELSMESGQSEKMVVRDLYFKPVEFKGDVEFENIQIESLGLEADSGSEEQNSIVFQPNGTAQSAVIQIGNGKNHYTITIMGSTGRAKVLAGTAEEVQSSIIDLDEQML